jgi:diguanylate cyclase (GGDEF)-like protein
MPHPPAHPRPVLLVEDDQGDAVLVERALAGSGFSLVHVTTRQDALAMLRTAPFAAALLDLSLPDSFGLEGVDALHACCPDLPILVITGLSDEQLALTALDRGAQDYLVKGAWSSELLVRALRYAIHRQSIQAENRRLMLELARQSRHDPLTGLLNRRALRQELDREWHRTSRTGQPLACVLLDLDYFKRINDTWGHGTGDEALCAVASLLRHDCRAADVVSRYGGEEFCVLLPDTTQAAAAAWAERIRAQLAQSPLKAEGATIPLTASFGIAQRTAAMLRADDLLDRADQALRLAKQLGRDRVVTADRLALPGAAAALCDQASPRALAADLMTCPQVLLGHNTPLWEVAQHLLGTRTLALPVVDEHGCLCGLVSEQELAIAVATADAWQLPVGQIMQRHPPAFHPDTPAQTLLELVVRSGISELVIVDNGRPLGMVSRFALLRWLFWSRRQAAPTPPAEPAGAVLGLPDPADSDTSDTKALCV